MGGPEVSTMAESEQHGRVLGDMLDLRKELMRTIPMRTIVVAFFIRGWGYEAARAGRALIVAGPLAGGGLLPG